MARPAGGRYKLADGTVVPSVTTVLGRFKNCGPLMYWSWREGMEGRDFRETRDKAASIGSLCHKMLECDWRGTKLEKDDLRIYTEEQIDKALRAFQGYRAWKEQSQLQVVEGEIPLVSERYKFGGTPDCIMVAGKLSLGDYKTSSGVYGDYLIQIAAYGQLWTENYPDRPIVGGYHLLRFSKETGDFEHRFFAELEKPWEAFKLMLQLYPLMNEIDKRAR